MNESDTSCRQTFSARHEECHFDPGAGQSRILTALANALKEKGPDGIRISGTDEIGTGTQAYAGSGRVFLLRQTLMRDRSLWMSGVNGGSTLGRDAGEMGAGLWSAQELITDLNELRPSARIQWQVIDKHISWDGYPGRQDTGMVDLPGGLGRCGGGS